MHIKNPTGNRVIQVQENESITIYLEDLSSGSRAFNLQVELLGDKAECFIEGRAHVTGNDRKIWRINQFFRGKNQTGKINVRGVAENQSFLQVDGAATLEQSSVDADAEINERVILFENGKSRLLPVLRVETDRVASASHGASVAPVEYEKILYFMSRGVSRTEAEKITKEGFLK